MTCVLFFNYLKNYKDRGPCKRTVFQSITAPGQLIRQGQLSPSASTPYSSPRNRLHWEHTDLSLEEGFGEPQLCRRLPVT